MGDTASRRIFAMWLENNNYNERYLCYTQAYIAEKKGTRRIVSDGFVPAVFIILNLRLGCWVGLRDFGLVITNFCSQVVDFELGQNICLL